MRWYRAGFCVESRDMDVQLVHDVRKIILALKAMENADGQTIIDTLTAIALWAPDELDRHSNDLLEIANLLQLGGDENRVQRMINKKVNNLNDLLDSWGIS